MGQFFPSEYKTFPFRAGDVVAQADGDGRCLTRILRVDEVTVPRGGTIGIAGQPIVATEDDSLLVVSCAFDEARYPTLEAAQAAFAAGRWEPSMLHVPMRATFLGPDDVLVGHRPVAEEELAGYRLWLADFGRGEAGIF